MSVKVLQAHINVLLQAYNGMPIAKVSNWHPSC